MKRYLILACMLMVLLSGCSRAEVVWETVDDEIVQPVSAEAPKKRAMSMSRITPVTRLTRVRPETVRADFKSDMCHPVGNWKIAKNSTRKRALGLEI